MPTVTGGLHRPALRLRRHPGAVECHPGQPLRRSPSRPRRQSPAKQARPHPRRHRDWPLIVVNVDDPAAPLALTDMLGQLTSRLHGWADSVTTLDLQVLAPGDATELLLRLTEKIHHSSPEDHAQAHLLAADLDCLPLVILQAASYILAEHLPLAEAHAFYQDQATALLGWFDAMRVPYAAPQDIQKSNPDDPTDVRTWPPMQAQALCSHAANAPAPSGLSWLLHQLGTLMHTKALHSQVEPLMRRVLAIHEARFGAAHPEVAASLNNLAQLLQATNRLAEAVPLLRRALAIFILSLERSILTHRIRRGTSRPSWLTWGRRRQTEVGWACAASRVRVKQPDARR